MKKIISIMFTLAITFVSSCKRDDLVIPSSSSTRNPDSSELAIQAIPLVPVVVAGSRDHAGYTNAIGTSARFNQPSGIFVNTDGTLLIADDRNGAVRKISNSVVTTILKNDSFKGIWNVATSKDGAIAFNVNGQPVYYKNGNYIFPDDIGCPHCSTGGFGRSADNSFFWSLTNIYDGESAVFLSSTNSAGENLRLGGKIADSDSTAVYARSVSTTVNDNKFITLQQTIYELTHSGKLVHILPNTKFDGLTSITVNKDGTKLMSLTREISN